MKKPFHSFISPIMKSGTFDCRKRYSKSVFYVISFVLIVFLWQNSFAAETNKNTFGVSASIEPKKGVSQRKGVDNAQQCLVDSFSKSKQKVNVMRWHEIYGITKNCSKGLQRFIPIMDNTPGTLEHKFYMMPITKFINDECSVVTFGIGGDVNSELHVQMMLPQCQFLGFDPNVAYQKLFENKLGGKYVRAGVASKKGSNTIQQLDGGKWHGVQGVNLESAAKLIKTYHGEDKLIDILNVDVEGFEYSVFEEMLTEKVFENACQVNFEIHPVWLHNIGYSVDDVISMFIKLAQNGTFLWVETTSFHNITYCIYFVNVKNEKCVEKYLKNRLL